MDPPEGNDAPLVLNAGSLRGLAHPVRVQILGILGLEGPATGTTLAQRLGVRTGTTSWHLQKLAEHGFVEEVPDRGTRRERWWRAATDGWQIDSAAFMSDPELADDTRMLLTAVIGQHLVRATQFVHEDWPASWRSAWMLSTTDGLVLDPDRLTAMRDELWEVVQRYRATPSSAGDAERVVVQVQAFPVRVGDQS